MPSDASYRADLIEHTALRRVWRVSGPFEMRIEWLLDHRGWRRSLGLERVYVDGVPVYREFVYTEGITGRVDFLVHTADGPVPCLIERHILMRHVAALRLTVGGIPLFGVGNLAYLPADRPPLPIPATGANGNAANLPLPDASPVEAS